MRGWCDDASGRARGAQVSRANKYDSESVRVFEKANWGKGERVGGPGKKKDTSEGF